MRFVIKVLRDAGLQLDIKKYKFEVIEITYLGMIVFTNNM
jgi:hypothetical protein